MLKGTKNYIFAALVILLGVVKMVTDIPVVESIQILGMSDPDTLISAGIAWALGRDALNTVASKK